MKKKYLLSYYFCLVFLIKIDSAISQNSTTNNKNNKIPGQEYQVGTEKASAYDGEDIEPKGKKVRVWNTSGPVPVGQAPTVGSQNLNPNSTNSLPAAVIVNTDNY